MLVLVGWNLHAAFEYAVDGRSGMVLLHMSAVLCGALAASIHGKRA